MASKSGSCFGSSDDQANKIVPSFETTKADLLATLVYDKLKTVDIVQGLPKVEEILEARKIKNPCILAPCNGYVNLRNSKIELTN